MANKLSKTSTVNSPSSSGSYAILEGFGGINTKDGHSTAKNDNSSASCVLDLRFSPDGSLSKRNGYRYLFGANQNIRAIWGGYMNGEYIIFYVAGNYVYYFDIKNKVSQRVSTIATTTTDISFIYHGDSLYLLDGSSFYRVGKTSLSASFGYAPLVAKDWRPGYIGEINEPLNILTRKARYTYTVADPPLPFLRTVYTPESISSVYVNGVPVSSELYYIDTDINAVVVRDLNTGDKVEVNVTLKNFANGRSDFLASTMGATFGSMSDSQLFIFGGKTKSKIYFSKYVDRESANASEFSFSGSGSLYFPEQNYFLAGNGQYAVMASSRHYDRLLLFTSGDTWMASENMTRDPNSPIIAINSSVGVSSKKGASLAGNSPVAITKNGIFAFNSNTDDIDELNSYSISRPIDSYLDQSFLSNAKIHFDKKRHELLIFGKSFASSEEGEELFLVYNIDSKSWVRFTNIRVELFFDGESDVGFVNGNKVYVFDDTCLQDLEENSSREIIGRYESNIFSSDNGRFNHLSELFCAFDSNGGDISVRIKTDGGFDKTFELSGAKKPINTEYSHTTVKKRLGGSRFKTGKLSLEIRGERSPLLHSLKLKVR